MKLVVVALFLVLVNSGCQTQQAPTKIYRDDTQAQEQSLNRPIVVGDATVLIDARSRLDTGLAKLAGSRPIRWEDFQDKDLGALARRLALLGLSPDQQVVVVGDGLRGKGEEGRVAWLLLYLGFQDVQTVDIESIKLRRTNYEEAPKQNAKPWEPRLRLHLLAENREVLKNALGKKPRTLHLIDVRSAKEYFARDKKTEMYLYPDLRAINIDWKEFFTKEGRPSPALKAQIEAVGIRPDDRVIVMSNEGVRSGAVTYAMTMMGYRNVGNYLAGWKSLKP